MIPLLIFVTVLLVLLCAGLWAELRSVTEDRDRMRDAVDARDRRIVELIRGEDFDDEHAMGGYDMPRTERGGPFEVVGDTDWERWADALDKGLTYELRGLRPPTPAMVRAMIVAEGGGEEEIEDAVRRFCR